MKIKNNDEENKRVLDRIEMLKERLRQGGRL
jgi:hypothetical protein